MAGRMEGRACAWIVSATQGHGDTGQTGTDRDAGTDRDSAVKLSGGLGFAGDLGGGTGGHYGG